MTQNEAGIRPDRAQYRAGKHDQGEDARIVQRGGSLREGPSIDGDWRKGDRAGVGDVTPRHRGEADGYRGKTRSYGYSDPPTMSREQKLAAMEQDSWKKEPVRQLPKQDRRSTRDRDRESRPTHERTVNGEHRGEYDRRDYRDHRDHRDRDERRDHRDHRDRDDRRDRDRDDRREIHSERYLGHSYNSNSWPGESGRSKGRAKESRSSGDKKKCFLLGEGAKRLNHVLNMEFKVCPRQDANPKHNASVLPTLTVNAAYLISYVVENLMEEDIGQEDGGQGGQEVECLIYGGEARAIVAAEHNVEDQKSRPTDLDLRFKIGDKSFESCRDVVERFLQGRLIDTTGTQMDPNQATSIIRQCYFQKQVVVGSDFSLLSIGDPVTGRNLDLEFTSSKCNTRCYFDDANAFVIPLPDPANKGWQRAAQHGKNRGAAQDGHKLMAVSQSAPWETAVEYIQKGQLNIDKPEDVFNGLPLYAHALSDKQLTPGNRDLEHDYGAKFAEKFLKQAEDTCKKGDDPLRFIKSFLKSHYPSRPLNALACLSQVLAVLRAHAVLEEITPERDTIAKKLGETLADLCCEAMHIAPLDKVLQVVRFAAHPFTAGTFAEGSVVRDETVNLRGGSVSDKCQSIRLRRQIPMTRNCEDTTDGTLLWEVVCKQGAEYIEKKQESETDESKRADVEAVCEALKGLGVPVSQGEDEISGELDHGSQCTDDDDVTDRQSAVASSKSINSLYMTSESSTSSPSHGDESGSLSGTDENDVEEVDGAAPMPDLARKPSQVRVTTDLEASPSPAPASPAPATASASLSVSLDSCPGTPTSQTSSRTPNSERRRTPNWSGGVYRPPARRSTSNTPQPS